MSKPPLFSYNPFSPNNIEGRAGRILIELEIPMLNAGFPYLCIAIAEAYRDPDVTQYVTKTLVPRVAKLCGDKSSAVHRAMIRAISTMRHYPNRETRKRYLGSEDAPTDILSIVTAVANYLRRQDEEDYDF